MTPCRLIIDLPADGAWNMALDEALLESAGQDDCPTLRFYGWREPTLSLGYFQSHVDRGLHAASINCPLVRRASGGGAILHDRELTYSMVVPQSHRAAGRPEILYQALHQSLIETLAEFGINAVFFKSSTSNHSHPVEEPFLCFQRRTAGDVLIGTHKVAGSAQRRRHHAVLQHGSVLLSSSEFAPELPGIAQLTSCSLRSEDLSQLWQKYISRGLGITLQRETLSVTLVEAAAEIARERFCTDSWNCRR